MVVCKLARVDHGHEGRRWSDDVGESTHGGSDTQPACFDCSICLEPVGEQQPVVTPCGHLYCRPCVRRWLHSGHPGAERCPVCKATVSEDRLAPLYGSGGRAADPCNQQSRRRRGAAGMAMGCRYDVDMQGGAALRSNVGRVIGSVAVAVLPWAFPDGRFPPRPALLHGGRRRRGSGRVEESLHQIWLFLAAFALVCFLLF